VPISAKLDTDTTSETVKRSITNAVKDKNVERAQLGAGETRTSRDPNPAKTYWQGKRIAGTLRPRTWE